MANKELRNPENAPGPFYVDDTCIDCDVCRTTSPQFYRREDEAGYSIVYRQPVNEEETRQAMDALENCPTDSIGCDTNDVTVEEPVISLSPNS